MFTRIALGMVAALVATEAAHADFSISKKATKSVSCTGGVCTATAKQANLNKGELANMLASGNATVKTGGGAVTIQVLDGFSWTSTHRLTLDAKKTIGFHQPVTVAGQGGLTIITNDGGSGGDLLFFDNGKVDFWDLSSSLVINGASYALEDTLHSIAEDIASNPSGSFALATDYDANVDGPYSQSPVITPFAGIFEGLGHTIDRMAISAVIRNSCVGLFGQIATGGTVRDLKAMNAAILSTGRNGKVGIIAGCNAGNVANSISSGSVRTEPGSNLGGLVGSNTGSISKSESAATVTADDSLKPGGNALAGGLVGFNMGDISHSSASGTVAGANASWAGGLVGWVNVAGTVSDSHASGAVINSGLKSTSGGLAGRGENILRSYATGSVTGGSGWENADGEILYGYTGGLAGVGINISDSYATSAVNGGDRFSIVGGLVGSGNGSQTGKSYSIGAVTGGEEASFVGGFVGKNSMLEDAYWDLDTSLISDPGQGCGDVENCPGVTGLSDAQLKSALPEGFDPNIWGQDANINNGYPYLLANPPPN